MTTTSNDALKGIRVVEFAVFAAGPLVGKHLGEHGAEVIRIESQTSPDGFRVHYPPFKDDRPGLERGGSYALFNDQVLGVTLNLKHPRAVALAKELVSKADIIIENFAQGVMDRLGLGYCALSEMKPDLIMLSSCNQGQTGRRAKHHWIIAGTRVRDSASIFRSMSPVSSSLYRSCLTHK